VHFVKVHAIAQYKQTIGPLGSGSYWRGREKRCKCSIELDWKTVFFKEKYTLLLRFLKEFKGF